MNMVFVMTIYGISTMSYRIASLLILHNQMKLKIGNEDSKNTWPTKIVMTKHPRPSNKLNLETDTLHDQNWEASIHLQEYGIWRESWIVYDMFQKMLYKTHKPHQCIGLHR